RPQLYPRREGVVVRVDTFPGAKAGEQQDLIYMFDPELRHQLDQLAKEIESAESQEKALSLELESASTQQGPRIAGERAAQAIIAKHKADEKTALLTMNNADRDPKKAGYFWVKAPTFPDRYEWQRSGGVWTVLSEDFQELTNRTVRPWEPV